MIQKWLRIVVPVLLISLISAVLAMGVFATEYTLDGKIYQLSDGSEYAFSSSHEVSSFMYGKDALGSPKVTGDVDQKTTYNGYTAFSTSGSITFSYTYDGSFQTDNKDNWNISSDSAKNVNGEKLSKKIKSGVVIVQRSQYGSEWENVQDPITDFFATNKSGSKNIFTISADENKNGNYYRVIIAYEMTRRTEKGTILGFINNDKYEYKECVEVYQFYVESNKNYVEIKDIVNNDTLENGATTADGFYVQKNGSTDFVEVIQNNGSSSHAGNYTRYTAPGTYTIKVTTNLGKIYTQVVNVSRGLAFTELSRVVYESDKNKGFPTNSVLNGNTVFGKSSLTQMYLVHSADTDISDTTKNGFDAYGVTGDSISVFMRLRVGTNAGNGWTVEYDKYGKKEKEKICGVSTGEIGKGALIVQKSFDGVNWTNVDLGKYSSGLYTTDYMEYYASSQNVLIYQPSGEDVINGVYLRISFAYQVHNDDSNKYKDYLEQYEFYLCSNALNAVAIHNLSVSEMMDEVLGDEDEAIVSLYKTAETMCSGACTTTGFTIDTSLNPTVTISVKHDGEYISAPSDGKYTNTGKYEIRITSAVGDHRDVVIYVDRLSAESALTQYFGEGFLSGKRIYAEDEYPVYEGGEVSYNLSALTDRFLPLFGTITNQTTGSVIEIAYDRTEKTGVIAEPGAYVAKFVTNPNYTAEDASGDTRVFTFYFSIIPQGTAPGPIINQQNLENYIKTNVSDAYPMYYGLTYRSAGKGNITIAFATRDAALQYAYNYEKGMVEKQEDGSYRYTGSLNVSQKEEYDSAWDLTDAMYFFAEQAIEVLFFDVSDRFTYLTLHEDVLTQVTNLRTLELDRSVTIVAEDQKELLCSLAALPIISRKPYAYLEPGTNGSVTLGYYDFEFIKDKYECDSSTVVIVDCNGVEYPIEYNEGVGIQLLEAGCATGVVTVIESTVYGDTSTYQAVFIGEGDNTAEIALEYYIGGEKVIGQFAQDQDGCAIAVDAFRISSVLDALDPYTLVTISGPAGKYHLVADRTPKDAWATPGEYTVAVTNRLGFEFVINVAVADSYYGTIEFSGDGTDDAETIITKYGEEKVALPDLTQYGYDLVGFTDENGAVYSGEIAVIMFKGAKVLKAVWEAKEFKLSFVDEKGNEVLPSAIVEFGGKYTLPNSVADNVTLLGWKLNGDLLIDQEISIDEEGDITLVAVLGDHSENLPDNGVNMPADTPKYGWIWVVIAISVFTAVGAIVCCRYRKKVYSRHINNNIGIGTEEGGEQ